jgi:N-acetylglucosaminyldiphosphoundecaprenol N-acetyl-beta-D-mannosaminyltransferase
MANAFAPVRDDFSRQVYCILGAPFDAIDMPSLVQTVTTVAANHAPFFISTLNLNYLVLSQRDREFRETLLSSDLCTADGMPIIWTARAMGLPFSQRVAGADLLHAIKTQNYSGSRLKLFLFGGGDGTVEAASRSLNAGGGGLSCVGALNPGTGTIEELSQNHFIEEINSSQADFLVVALGARKGQLWLHRNTGRLKVPVRAHLGATINFVAGNLRRAPPPLSKIGFEWLWRIKEEPYLWRRYWSDGRKFFRLLLVCVLPLAVQARWQRLFGLNKQGLAIELTQNQETITLRLTGSATAYNVDKAIPVFRDAAACKKNIAINLSGTRVIDQRFLGLLLMLRKRAKSQGSNLTFTGAPAGLEKSFRLNGADFLLVSSNA